ncbi:sushi, nidogen and EGF-like domain-containing protein 1 [Vigna unguiculata]|uniref:Jagged n=1 Tax=Vigna unguiculata TaxID=3917 RepID=A0A4D6NEW6_VIGUN|nr:sushi, nidogen and EGF-like domain-containing protein 1 [Vigna unguiculata]QCE12350.1 jagged [Vigna unguiculata]
MSITTRIYQVVAVSFLLESLNVYSFECEDDRCKTGFCNSSGACICNLPDPSTILNGNRTFLGGKFCDEEMSMCDGTNSFWCEHGGSCEEIVQGEKYSCNCPDGFGGEHCEHSGAPCGESFCFHNAECLAEAGDVCQCPSEWRGSADCSLLTKPTDFNSNSTETKLSKVSSSSSDSNKTLAVLALSSVGAAVAGAIYGKKVFSKKKREAVKFQQLSEIQASGIFDDDDDDDEDQRRVPQRIHADISHI